MAATFKPLPAPLIQTWLDAIRMRGVTPGLQDAAGAVGKTVDAARFYLTRHHRTEYQTAQNDYLATVKGSGLRTALPCNVAESAIQNPPASTFPLDVPVRPFTVRVPAPAIVTSKNKVFKAVVYGDTHVPFHDAAAVKVVQAITQDVKPDVLLNVGDLVDCWQISRFDKNPNRRDTLQDNIDEARQHLAEMAQLAPKARRVLLEGNHENRLSRTIAGLEGAQRELATLRIFTQGLTWPNLLETDAIGFEWVGDREQSKTPILPKLITKHGNLVRKDSGATAKAEHEKYGRSGLSGHTHRLGHFMRRDANGIATWLETGCTCLLEPEYGTDFNWQQGLVVLTWSADRRLMDAHPTSIRDGSALWRDAEVAA